MYHNCSIFMLQFMVLSYTKTVPVHVMLHIMPPTSSPYSKQNKYTFSVFLHDNVNDWIKCLQPLSFYSKQNKYTFLVFLHDNVDTIIHEKSTLLALVLMGDMVVKIDFFLNQIKILHLCSLERPYIVSLKKKIMMSCFERLLPWKQSKMAIKQQS